jgi:cilla- and flagella-associated protein
METEEGVILTEEKILKICHKKSPEEVTKINAFAMSITLIPDLSAFINLKIISLSLNSIESLKPFQDCLLLKELHLRKNSISKLEEISYLKDLPELEILFLSDNPCCQIPFYRSKVIRTLKHLVTLDSVSINEIERDKAIEDCDELIVIDDLVSHELAVLTASDVERDPELSTLLSSPRELEPFALPPPQLVPDVKSSPESVRQRPSPSNTLLATRLLLHDLPIDEVKQLMIWCEERLRLSESDRCGGG